MLDRFCMLNKKIEIPFIYFFKCKKIYNTMQFNYSYLLQEREFINSNQNVYKVGKS